MVKFLGSECGVGVRVFVRVRSVTCKEKMENAESQDFVVELMSSES